MLCAVITRFIYGPKVTIFDGKYRTAPTDCIAYTEHGRGRSATPDVNQGIVS
jgi:hypothetical protein